MPQTYPSESFYHDDTYEQHAVAANLREAWITEKLEAFAAEGQSEGITIAEVSSNLACACVAYDALLLETLNGNAANLQNAMNNEATKLLGEAYDKRGIDQ